jgi:hypothetical protein
VWKEGATTYIAAPPGPAPDAAPDWTGWREVGVTTDTALIVARQEGKRGLTAEAAAAALRAVGTAGQPVKHGHTMHITAEQEANLDRWDAIVPAVTGADAAAVLDRALSARLARLASRAAADTAPPP